MRVWPGKPYPLGASWDGEGVNFAIHSETATSVELCLFSGIAAEREARVALGERTQGVWHAYLPDLRPGQAYGYRVDGPYRPEKGLRHNARKLLIDPYARAIAGAVDWGPSVYGYDIQAGDDDRSVSDSDSAAFMPRSIVVEPAFTWGDDTPPTVPWTDTLLYECHVRGMTMRHPGIDEGLRGTYLGLSSDPILEHLLSLGVTSVELLPVHHCLSEPMLAQRGASNYWGYNTIGFFAPDARYATGALGQQVSEFKTMVKRFHRAGVEVILDVVYNHTAESSELGPTLSFRGIDNRAYYHLSGDGGRHYVDYTGCGNSLNGGHPRTLQLVMDSLRYWVSEMHVDGFRFDLAPVLAREHGAYDRFATFFGIIHQDPVLSRVKLIAEPWDIGRDGYQVGNFPNGWSEWNGKYRDAIRRFWRGDSGVVPELAYRLSGSSDLYGDNGRTPRASVNFVTCHDGFTLRDLVSYERKHNEENGEDNRDGTDNNLSRNWGAEGDTDAAEVRRMRERMQRNFLATLLFSQGVPMISHGDEIGRTQGGNNNAYCQDNEISWLDWELDAERRDLLEFVRRLTGIVRSNPVLRRHQFFSGSPGHKGNKDVQWLRRDGREMGDDDWSRKSNQLLGMLIDGRAAAERDSQGRQVAGDTLLLLLNGGARSRHFTLPVRDEIGVWHELVNTARQGTRIVRSAAVNLVGRSLILLRFAESGAVNDA